MSVPDFLDTNVLVYAYDTSYPEKQNIARALLKSGIAGKLVISTQVLAEFAATLLHKISPPPNADAVMKGLDAMAPIRLIIPDVELIRRAVEVRASYGIHFYDGMIVAAAERAGCGRIWSEDFNAGQKYFGITVTNPFH
jgi:predicted nucleic acid-binding protein